MAGQGVDIDQLETIEAMAGLVRLHSAYQSNPAKLHIATCAEIAT